MAAGTNRGGWLMVGAIGMTLDTGCAIATWSAVRGVAAGTVGVMRLGMQRWQRAWFMTTVARWRLGDRCTAARRTGAVRFMATVATVFDSAVRPSGSVRMTARARRHRRSTGMWLVTSGAIEMALWRARRFDAVAGFAFGDVGLRRMLRLMATRARLMAFVRELALRCVTACASWRWGLG